jgi:hypothetical protein
LDHGKALGLALSLFLDCLFMPYQSIPYHYPIGFELAVPIIITIDAYDALRNTFEGVSDEHIIRLLIEYLRENR